MEEGFAKPSPTLTHPRVEVSFAPTRSFAKAFPSELAEQQRKFTTPTWAHRIEEEPAKEKEKEATVAVAPPKPVGHAASLPPKLDIHPVIAIGLGMGIFFGTMYAVRYLRKWFSTE